MDYCMHEEMTADELLEWARWNFKMWRYDNESSQHWYILMLWAERVTS